MVNKNNIKTTKNRTPIFVASTLVVFSVLIYFVMKTIRFCPPGNPACFLDFVKFLPLFPFAYGVSIFIAYFINNYSDPAGRKERNVYELAFRIFVILGIIAAILPWFAAF